MIFSRPRTLPGIQGSSQSTLAAAHCFGRVRGGYVFLVGVLVIGVVATATMLSLLLLGWAAEQNGFALQQSSQAYAVAHTCAEQVLRGLKGDLTYLGSGTLTFTEGSCKIRPIGGSGNFYRRICVEGVSGKSTRRVEMLVERLYPSTRVASAQEVLSFSLCP